MSHQRGGGCWLGPRRPSGCTSVLLAQFPGPQWSPVPRGHRLGLRHNSGRLAWASRWLPGPTALAFPWMGGVGACVPSSSWRSAPVAPLHSQAGVSGKPSLRCRRTETEGGPQERAGTPVGQPLEEAGRSRSHSDRSPAAGDATPAPRRAAAQLCPGHLPLSSCSVPVPR